MFYFGAVDGFDGQVLRAFVVSAHERRLRGHGGRRAHAVAVSEFIVAGHPVFHFFEFFAEAAAFAPEHADDGGDAEGPGVVVEVEGLERPPQYLPRLFVRGAHGLDVVEGGEEFEEFQFAAQVYGAFAAAPLFKFAGFFREREGAGEVLEIAFEEEFQRRAQHYFRVAQQYLFGAVVKDGVDALSARVADGLREGGVPKGEGEDGFVVARPGIA